ncbi:hypothetical protein AC1031_010776 [Aphanomyces cochlioides]|nr:hypothetical protein AC1031_010776 [Aphanomyces cochlioides]
MTQHRSALKEWWATTFHHVAKAKRIAIPECLAHETAPRHLVGGKLVPFLPNQAAIWRHHRDLEHCEPIDENLPVLRASPTIEKPQELRRPRSVFSSEPEEPMTEMKKSLYLLF